jgi:hypothetical protein
MKKKVLSEKSEPKKEEKREASMSKSKRASVEKKEAYKKK